jgi:polyisoprenoid-binding protein YceI
MPLRSGRYTLGPGDGTLRVMTGREGAAALMGHDLTLEAARWAATVNVDAEDPSRSRVRATVEAASLVVRDARGGPIRLTDSQRDEIGSIVRDKVLRSDRYPTITFRSTSVVGDVKRASVTGTLTIGRRTREASLQLRVARSKLPRIVATTSIVQTDFGIQPYSALRGALRVKDVVEVRLEVRLPAL